jgi:ATP-dependent protease Clp ATPase subunit
MSQQTAISATATGDDQKVGFRAIVMKQAIEHNLAGIAENQPNMIVRFTRKTGARGLRSIIESILLDTMFELPSLEGVTGVEITKQVVEGTAPPLHIYSDRSNQKSDAIA